MQADGNEAKLIRLGKLESFTKNFVRIEIDFKFRTQL